MKIHCENIKGSTTAKCGVKTFTKSGRFFCVTKIEDFKKIDADGQCEKCRLKVEAIKTEN